jgi:hypothetical protein
MLTVILLAVNAQGLEIQDRPAMSTGTPEGRMWQGREERRERGVFCAQWPRRPGREDYSTTFNLIEFYGAEDYFLFFLYETEREGWWRAGLLSSNGDSRRGGEGMVESEEFFLSQVGGINRDDIIGALGPGPMGRLKLKSMRSSLRSIPARVSVRINPEIVGSIAGGGTLEAHIVSDVAGRILEIVETSRVGMFRPAPSVEAEVKPSTTDGRRSNIDFGNQTDSSPPTQPKPADPILAPE